MELTRIKAAKISAGHCADVNHPGLAMEWERIRKYPEDCVGANLLDYEEYARTFSWAQARALLYGLAGGGLNIAHEAVDRHVLAGRGAKLALRWIGRDARIRDFSYTALRAQTNRFANILVQHGLAEGRPGVLAPRAQSGTLHRRSRHECRRPHVGSRSCTASVLPGSWGAAPRARLLTRERQGATARDEASGWA